MKKRIMLMTLVAVLVVGMVIGGCAKPAPAPTTPTTPTTPAVTTPTTPAAPKVYEWKMQTIIPAAMERFSVNLAHYAEMVGEYTQGRIKLTMYPAPAIVPADQVADACAQNIVEMAEFVGSYWAGKFPVCNIEYGLPMAYQSREDTATIMWYHGLQDLMVEALATRGLHYLGFETTVGTRLMTTKPIRTLDDFKGMKIRAIGSHADFMAKLGAGTVNIPMVELYMGLKLGTIEGAITGLDVQTDLKLQEISKYYLAKPKLSGSEPLSILVNLDQWQALPQDLKDILTLTTRVFTHWAWITQENPRETKCYGVLRDAGVEFTELSPEDEAKMLASAVEIWDQWAAKDSYCARAVAIIKDYVREQGRIK